MIKKKNRNWVERYALALLLREEEMWLKYSSIISESMFKNELRKIIYRFAKAHMGRISYKVLLNEIRERSGAIGTAMAVRCQTAYSDMKKFKIRIGDSEYIIKSLFKYNSTDKTFKWMREYIELVEKGELEKAEKLKFKNLLHSSNSREIGVDKGEIVKDFKERLDLVKDKIKNPDKYKMCKTGIKKLDRMIGGLSKGEFILLAGHTSAGKSTLALNIAYRNQLRGAKVLYFINEMPRIQVESKYDSIVTKIPYKKFKLAKLRKNDFKIWKRKIKNLRRFGGQFHVISVSTNCTPTLIREMVKLYGNVDLVIVDSLLYMTTGNRGFSEQSELGNITNDLKNMAMQYEVPVIGLTQLTAESLEKDRLDFADIGYSRKMTHIADIVLGIPNIQEDDDALNIQLVKCRDDKNDEFFKIWMSWEICRANNKPPAEVEDGDSKEDFE